MSHESASMTREWPGLRRDNEETFEVGVVFFWVTGPSSCSHTVESLGLDWENGMDPSDYPDDKMF